LFIGLDAASRDLVMDWAAEGVMPNLQRLGQLGARGLTENAPGIYTGSVWPSVWTATTPGRHGCYYNEQLVPGSYQMAGFLADEVKQVPFWEALSQAGRRIALFDVPKAKLCESLNGVHIVDWGTHDSDFVACSWPRQLIEDIHSRYGAAPFRRCDWVMDGPDPERTLRKHLLWRVKTKLAIAEELLAQEPWDLFMVGFGDSHCVGHQCWHVHDPSHPKHDPALREQMGDPVKDVYIELDKAVGRLLDLTGPETRVFLLCTHGMAAHYDATYFLDEVLRLLEGSTIPPARAFLDHARRLWKKLPLNFTEKFGTIARTVHRLPDAGDRGGRRCFAVPTNSNSAGIRLNLAGREPDGKLLPGPQAEQFVSQLIADLHELTEPSDGRRLVKEVILSREAFPGEHAELLPDLFVRWNRDKPITGASSPKIGTLIREDHTSRRTGDHRPGGMYFLRGPGIPRGERLPVARDEDIAPTLAGFLDVQLENADGRPLVESVAG
jgi:predicted AlkP superfamily phosphohydrolase/phosphomutase